MFWRVAPLLVGVLGAVGLGAVLLSGWFAADRSRDLVRNTIRQRLDVVAEEIEFRADLTFGIDSLTLPVQFDLRARFPDPVYPLRADGTVASYAWADAVDVPPLAKAALDSGSVYVELERDVDASWGVAPVYDADGYLAGGLLVLPLRETSAEELLPSRRAYRRSMQVVGALSVLLALGLGLVFARWLVRPLRRITKRVEAIGEGDYASRLPVRSSNELGRLSASINAMAEAVESSIEALRSTDRVRRELVANVGHDLRTPLAALTGYAEEAKRYLTAGRMDDAATALDTASRQAEYLRKLLEDLFELSVLDAVPPPLRIEPVPLAELLHESARLHAGPMRERGLTFRIDVPADLPILEADGLRLMRLLDNLLSNACRHTSAGGTVTLHAEASEEAVYVSVGDTGEGMDPETAAHVFDRYYRGTGARTRKSRTGLGLSISKAVAVAHGGDLAVESYESVGTTFTLTLPNKKSVLK